MLKTIIVDDEALSVNRLKNLLAIYEDIEVCGTFMDPREAQVYAKMNSVQLAFLDVSMPEISGMELSGMLLEHDPSIIVIFVTSYDEYAVEAFERNALDYLMKPVTEQRLSKTLDKIRDLQRLHHGIFSSEKKTLSSGILTGQESRIIQCISEGLSNKEIAETLNITVETVKYHLKNIYRKLEVNNRVRALQRAKGLNIL